MTKIKCQISNVNKVKLLSERTSGVPPVIFFLDTERFQSISIVFLHQEYQHVNILSTPWKQHTYCQDDGTDNVEGKHDDHNDSVCFLDESNISPPVAYQIPRMCIH